VVPSPSLRQVFAGGRRRITEHYTDTQGYTDLVFGLFELLGFRLAPRGDLLQALHSIILNIFVCFAALYAVKQTKLILGAGPARRAANLHYSQADLPRDW
jgi:hypothetical protein